jgi:hypothetical protein
VDEPGVAVLAVVLVAERFWPASPNITASVSNVPGTSSPPPPPPPPKSVVAPVVVVDDDDDDDEEAAAAAAAPVAEAVVAVSTASRPSPASLPMPPRRFLPPLLLICFVASMRKSVLHQVKCARLC